MASQIFFCERIRFGFFIIHRNFRWKFSRLLWFNLLLPFLTFVLFFLSYRWLVFFLFITTVHFNVLFFSFFRSTTILLVLLPLSWILHIFTFLISSGFDVCFTLLVSVIHSLMLILCFIFIKYLTSVGFHPFILTKVRRKIFSGTLPISVIYRLLLILFLFIKCLACVGFHRSILIKIWRKTFFRGALPVSVINSLMLIHFFLFIKCQACVGFHFILITIWRRTFFTCVLPVSVINYLSLIIFLFIKFHTSFSFDRFILIKIWRKTFSCALPVSVTRSLTLIFLSFIKFLLTSVDLHRFITIKIWRMVVLLFKICIVFISVTISKLCSICYGVFFTNFNADFRLPLFGKFLLTFQQS